MATPILPTPLEFEEGKFSLRSVMCSDAIPGLRSNMDAFARFMEWLYQKRKDGTWELSDAFAAELRNMNCVYVTPEDECVDLGLSVAVSWGDTIATITITGTNLKANDKWRLYRKESDEEDTAYAQVYPVAVGDWATAASANFSHEDTGLTNGTAYTYKIEAQHENCDVYEATTASGTPSIVCSPLFTFQMVNDPWETLRPYSIDVAEHPFGYLRKVTVTLLAADPSFDGMRYRLYQEINGAWVAIDGGYVATDAGKFTFQFTWNYDKPDADTAYRFSVFPDDGCAQQDATFTVPGPRTPSAVGGQSGFNLIVNYDPAHADTDPYVGRIYRVRVLLEARGGGTTWEQEVMLTADPKIEYLQVMPSIGACAGGDSNVPDPFPCLDEGVLPGCAHLGIYPRICNSQARFRLWAQSINGFWSKTSFNGSWNPY